MTTFYSGIGSDVADYGKSTGSYRVGDARTGRGRHRGNELTQW